MAEGGGGTGSPAPALLPREMGTVTFTFADQDRTITEEDARRLLGQVRTAPVLTEPASSAVAKLSEAISQGSGVETTPAEKHELIAALERGASKPRSAELRRLEIELRTALYAETYSRDE